jgi:hypothetical protein
MNKKHLNNLIAIARMTRLWLGKRHEATKELFVKLRNVGFIH